MLFISLLFWQFHLLALNLDMKKPPWGTVGEFAQHQLGFASMAHIRLRTAGRADQEEPSRLTSPVLYQLVAECWYHYLAGGCASEFDHF